MWQGKECKASSLLPENMASQAWIDPLRKKGDKADKPEEEESRDDPGEAFMSSDLLTRGCHITQIIYSEPNILFRLGGPRQLVCRVKLEEVECFEVWIFP